jgi:large subunit ribosomal protein L6
MSRKGKQPISIPTGVEVKVNGSKVSVKGPKGNLSHDIMEGLVIKIEKNELEVILPEAISSKGNFHGLYRGLINNMVVGVSHGFEKKLEMQGVGYRAAVQGNLLDIQVGLSHPMKLEIPKELQVKVDKNTAITITGADKQQVGQFAATVRSVKPPEPYQGKGIRYVGEHVRRKAGKAAAKK